MWNVERSGLWRQPEFLKLWAGETVSLFGSQLTLLALPLTAVLTLNATPAQMGLLGALEYAPFLLFGLPAGAWVDRLRRRPILMTANVARALLLATIPLAAWLGVLRIEQLYVVGFLVGIGTVFFDVAYQSFLPVLVGREHLLEGNSKLESSRSLAQVAGPGLGGVLVQALTAPAAIALDAASFVVSVMCIGSIRTVEPPVVGGAGRRQMLDDIRQGLALVVGNPALRGIAGCTATNNLFGSIASAVYVLYVSRAVGLSPAQLGLAFAAFGPGGLLGALLAPMIARRFGLGPTLVGAMTFAPIGWWLVLAADQSSNGVVVLVAAANALFAISGTVYNINQVSLRQALTPDHLLGRMNATMRFIVWGTIPIGALLGGAIGRSLGLRAALAIGGAGALLAPLWLLLTPARTIRAAATPMGPGGAAVPQPDGESP